MGGNHTHTPSAFFLFFSVLRAVLGFVIPAELRLTPKPVCAFRRTSLLAFFGAKKERGGAFRIGTVEHSAAEFIL